jgi:hypothetical protein
MDGVTFQQILELLGPNRGFILWNILLYLIFFLSLLTVLTMPDKNLLPTLIMVGVVMLTVIAKLSISAVPPLLRKNEFGMFMINVGIFVLPLLTAGIVRARKKGRTVILCIVAGILGGMYFFFFWALEQR